jgi:phosphatidylglycerophosphate synthase
MAPAFLSLFGYLIGIVDTLLFFLMNVYDKLVYGPLQKYLSPLVVHIPRDVTLGGRKMIFLTANRVTLGRTVLVIPIAICLKFQYYFSGCMLIVLHDFLDHVDGIVAKVHRSYYGSVDSPILGSFLDAFCDKVVNVFTLWSILLFVDYQHFSLYQLIIFTGLCSAVIVYEIILGVVRVQDYFHAFYSFSEKGDKQPSIQASMEGKTKEKLESMGLAFFCLSLGYGNPMDSWCERNNFCNV